MTVACLPWCLTISTTIATALNMTTIGPSSLPRYMSGMALGYDETSNIVWLLGSRFYYQYSLMSFNLSIWNNTNAMIDYGANDLSNHISCNGQSYVQNEDVVYVTAGYMDKILAYDVYTRYLHTTNTGPSLSHDGCLASIGDWIIYTNLNNTYILTISNQSWTLSGNPIMLYQRTGHACNY